MEENESQSITTRSAGIRYGVIYGVISIAYFLVLMMANIDMSQGFGRWGGSVIAIVVVLMAHKYFKENGDGFMTYGQGVGIGFWIGLIASVISGIFTYIYAKFLDTGFIPMIREKAIADMEAKGQANDASIKMVEMFTSAEALPLFGLFIGILTLVIIALIISIFTQKSQPETSI